MALSAQNIEVLPCCVVKLKNVLSASEQQHLWDTLVCSGFDYRAVEGPTNQGANMWYTKTPGAPDILLHYNYYEPPVGSKKKGLKRSMSQDCHVQPPPMAVLCAADKIFAALRAHDLGRHVLEAPEASAAEDSEEANGAASSSTPPKEDAAADNGSGARLEVGTRVKGHYMGGSETYPGFVSRVRPDGTYDIDYDDGDKERRVGAHLVVLDALDSEMPREWVCEACTLVNYKPYAKKCVCCKTKRPAPPQPPKAQTDSR